MHGMLTANSTISNSFRVLGSFDNEIAFSSTVSNQGSCPCHLIVSSAGDMNNGVLF